MQLSIIIVNWMSVDYLNNCLKSVFRYLNNKQVEVIVIDNASYDGSANLVVKKYPSVRFIQNKTNVGFSHANNKAFKVSTGKLILFLNPDTELTHNSVNLLVQALETLPRGGAVGPTLLNTDMSIQTSCVQAFPTPLNQALDFDLLRKRYPKWRLWGMRELYSGGSRPAAVDVVSGACLLVKRDVFEAVNLFSTDYFMYTEDVDLCYKIQKAGYRVYYVPEAKVIHHGGKSSGRSEISFFHELVMRDSVGKFIKNRQGSIAEKIYKVTLGLSALFRLIIIAAIMLIKRKNDSYYIKLSPLYIKWQKILKWAAGRAPEIKRFYVKQGEEI